MERPLAITLLAALAFVLGIACLLGSVVLFYELRKAGATGNTGAETFALRTLGPSFWLVSSVVGPVALVVGIGLWKLRNWARVLSIILAVLGLLRTPIFWGSARLLS